MEDLNKLEKIRKELLKLRIEELENKIFVYEDELKELKSEMN